MASPVARWKALDKSDRAFFLGSLIIPLALWWIYTGREKYGTKGLK